MGSKRNEKWEESCDDDGDGGGGGGGVVVGEREWKIFWFEVSLKREDVAKCSKTIMLFKLFYFKKLMKVFFIKKKWCLESYVWFFLTDLPLME